MAPPRPGTSRPRATPPRPRVRRLRAGGRAPEGKEKGRALLDRGLGPDAPAVAVDDALHDGQPHTGALVLLGAVQPLEDAEELVRVRHIKAHAIVRTK